MENLFIISGLSVDKYDNNEYNPDQFIILFMIQMI